MDIDRGEHQPILIDLEVDVSPVKGESEGVDEEADCRFPQVKEENDEKYQLDTVHHRINPDNGVCDVKGGVFDFRDNEFESKHSVGTSADALETKSGVLEHALLSEKCSAPVYKSLMTEFDEYVAKEKSSQIGTSRALRYGLEVGDMVWGKVKSHPWWPGHIFNEALASSLVRRARGDGSVLVAFFGDSSYGWFDPAELIPFDANFADKSKQTASRNFVKAVEEAMDETSRRSALGLICKCRSKFNFRPASAQGYYSVDVPDYEPGGFYSSTQIRKSRDSFVPSETLSFIQQLAVAPQSSDETSLGFIKNRAISFAYRKAVFEEFDETYAQAFGAPAVTPSHDASGAKAQPVKVPTRAPLSGPLVIAEALGGGKNPSKPMKVKDHSKKDKYLFKRRDEPSLYQVSISQAGSSVPAAYVQTSSAASAGGYVLQKRPPSVPTTSEQDSSSTVVIVANASSPDAKPSGSFQGSREKLGVSHLSDDPLKEAASGAAQQGRDHVQDGSGDRVVVKKKKAVKRPPGELPTDSDSVTIEKKKKKKRKEIGSEAGAPEQPKKRLATGKVDQVPVSTSNIELPQLLSGLQGLALNHFHASEGVRVSAAVVRQSFLRFRSLVFQKSLVLSPEPDTVDVVPPRKSLSGGDQINNLKAKPKLVKPSMRPDDPAKGGRKRAPSDRQEEMGAKRIKNINKIKSLPAEKKSVLKVQKGAEAKEIAAMSAASATASATPLKKLGLVKKSYGQPPPPPQPKKAAVPTMLVMKFPPKTSLPSVAELKARFARFGPLDYSSLRVFWKSSTCRVVFQHKPDAEAAFKYALGNSSLFGNVNVRYFVREVEEATDPPVRSSPSDDLDRPVQPSPFVQPVVQQPLKSCLKKPGEDAGPANGGRGTARVKFILGGEENPNPGPPVVVGGGGREGSGGSFADVVGPSSSSTTTTGTGSGLVVNSKNFQKSSTVLPPLLPIPTRFHNNSSSRNPPRAEISTTRNPTHLVSVSAPTVDISQQMISLLNRCNEVVTNLSGALGYVPYHPL